MIQLQDFSVNGLVELKGFSDELLVEFVQSNIDFLSYIDNPSTVVVDAIYEEVTSLPHVLKAFWFGNAVARTYLMMKFGPIVGELAEARYAPQ